MREQLRMNALKEGEVVAAGETPPKRKPAMGRTARLTADIASTALERKEK